MAKILLSIPDELLEAFDTYIEKEQYERSEFMRKLIRDVVYPKDISLNTNTIKGSLPVQGDKEKSSQTIGYCKLHWSEKVPVTLVTWEDENGTPIIREQYICDRCLDKYKNLDHGKLHILGG